MTDDLFEDEKQPMTPEQRLQAEKEELNRLISKGMTFKVDRVLYIRKKGFWNRLKKPVKKVETLEFTIEEPTLSTLDRISRESIELVIDDEKLKSSAGMSEAKRYVMQHARRMARIVAMAVLGENYLQVTQIGDRLKYVENRSELKQLENIFYLNIKPSRLAQLVMMINTIGNLGDFMISTRSMSAARTTIPDRVEQEG